VFIATTLLYHSCKFWKCGKNVLTLEGTCNALIIFVGKKGRDRLSWNMTEIGRENMTKIGRENMTEIGRENIRMAGRSGEKLCLLQYRRTAKFRQIVPMLH
jgi:hypothetical protein